MFIWSEATRENMAFRRSHRWSERSISQDGEWSFVLCQVCCQIDIRNEGSTATATTTPSPGGYGCRGDPVGATLPEQHKTGPPSACGSVAACKISSNLKGGVSVRLTDERWTHEAHFKMAGLRLDVLETVADPSVILEGHYGAFMAVREIAGGKYLVVIYKETSDDGFVITAFMTRRQRFLASRKRIWPG